MKITLHRTTALLASVLLTASVGVSAQADQASSPPTPQTTTELVEPPPAVPQVTDTTLNLADPGFIATDAGVTIYGTGRVKGEKGAFPASSAAFFNDTYSPQHNSLSELPGWIGVAPSMGRRLWAPSVQEVNGTYVMYYTAWHQARGRNCIGVATSQYASSSFMPQGPPICAPIERDGKAPEAIDPSAYISAEGNCYMVFKSSMHNKRRFKIWAKPMGTDCTTRGSRPKLILWQKHRIEAPFVLNPAAVEGGVYLFVSRHRYKTCAYDIQVFRADSLWEGNFSRSNSKVLFNQEMSGLCGPGGATPVDTPSGTRIAFHAWDTANPGADEFPTTEVRSTYTARIEWDNDGWPIIR